MSSSRQALTGWVQNSRVCTHDVVSDGCADVPPTPVPGCSRPVCQVSCSNGVCPLPKGIDGVLSPHEYDGATELPYTDEGLHAEATVHIKAFQYDSGFKVGRGYMNVFLENIPMIDRIPAGDKTSPGINSTFVVYVDFNRFTGVSPSVGPEDRFFVIDLRGINPAGIFSYSSAGTLSYLGRAAFHAGTCGPDPSTGFVLRCNGELRIPIDGNDMKPFPSPDDDVDPGVGFALVPFPSYFTDINNINNTFLAGVPEVSLVGKLPKQLRDDRGYALSLLFARPKGFKAQFMTWNVRRSSISKLAGPFSQTTDDAVGTWLADKADVIGLQEGWNQVMMAQVVNRVTIQRAQLGLEPFYLYGPPDVEGGWFKDMLSNLGGIVAGGNEGSSGGTWILSKFPIGPHGFHVYSADACKGEDCFKAKGVLWARIMLNPPTPANTNCSVFKGGTCGPPPSGDDFVDVFDTHLQATNTDVCSDQTTHDLLMARLADYLAGAAVLEPWLVFARAVRDNDLNCGVSDQEIQRRQLDELNAFIESHMAHDRPAIVMGDFNIDGKELGDSGSMYREMLRRLHIGPINPQAYGGNAALDNDDMENPWPLDFDWDVDHGDLARQWHTPWPSKTESDGNTTYGECMRTVVGDESSGVAYDANCPEGDYADGHARYDYILVRPPYQSDEPNFIAPQWVAETIDGDPWRSPYPGSPPSGVDGKTFTGPPDRLSDHKPVTVGLELAKLEHLPKFHPTWKHDLELGVASYDASNQGDCSGAVDPYASMWAGFVDQQGQKNWDMQGNRSFVCQDTAAASFPADSCMVNWRYETIEQGTEQAHALGTGLWDQDSSSGNDELWLNNGGTWPTMWVNWGNPTTLALLGWQGQSIGVKPWQVSDTAPVPLSTIVPGAGGPTDMCLQFTATELPPGEQF